MIFRASDSWEFHFLLISRTFIRFIKLQLLKIIYSFWSRETGCTQMQEGVWRLLNCFLWIYLTFLIFGSLIIQKIIKFLVDRFNTRSGHTKLSTTNTILIRGGGRRRKGRYRPGIRRLKDLGMAVPPDTGYSVPARERETGQCSSPLKIWESTPLPPGVSPYTGEHWPSKG